MANVSYYLGIGSHVPIPFLYIYMPVIQIKTLDIYNKV